MKLKSHFSTDVRVSSWSLKCFYFILGNEVPSQHCCQVPWKPDVISVCDWQSLGCEDHRLGFARLQGWTGKSQCKPKEGLYRYIFRKKDVKMTFRKQKSGNNFAFVYLHCTTFKEVLYEWNVAWPVTETYHDSKGRGRRQLVYSLPSPLEKIGKSTPLSVIFFPEGKGRMYIG